MENKQFFVKTDEGSLTIPLNLDMTLNQLKDINEEKRKYPRHIYFLKFNGHGMYENKTLRDYNVIKDCTIHTCIRCVKT